MTLKNRKTLGKLLAWVSCGFVVAATVLWLTPEEGPVDVAAEPELALPVTVLPVTPGPWTSQVQANGVTQALWQTDFGATVAGRLAESHPGLPGTFVSQGEALIAIAPQNYQADVDAQMARLANAQLNLARIKNEQTAAKSLGRVKTAFGRMEPQVQAAKAELRAAESALTVAKTQLAETRITAPFDAVILARQVTPGQWVTPGAPLFRLAASHALEITVPLTQHQWQQLGNLALGNQAKVATQIGQHYSAKVRYLSPVLDSSTRQRSVVLQVDQPFHQKVPLLPDEFVTVTFSGTTLANVVQLPTGTITDGRFVWVLESGRLVKTPVDILNRGNTEVVARFVQQTTTSQSKGEVRQVVRYPLNSMIAGQRAQSVDLWAAQAALDVANEGVKP